MTTRRGPWVFAACAIALAAAGCGGEPEPRKPAPAAAQAPAQAQVAPRPGAPSAHDALLDEAKSLGAFPRATPRPQIATDLLPDLFTNRTGGRVAASVQSGGLGAEEGTLVVVTLVEPETAADVVELVRLIGEKHAFHVEKIELARADGRWRGRVAAAPVLFDPEATGDAAERERSALRAYRDGRGEAAKQLATALDVHEAAAKIALAWDARDGEYEVEVEVERGATERGGTAAPAPPAAPPPGPPAAPTPPGAAVEPRPEKKSAHDAMVEEADGLGAYSATAPAPKIANDVLANAGPALLAKAPEVQFGGVGAPDGTTVVLTIEPTAAAGVVETVRRMCETHAFHLEKVDLARDGDRWRGTIAALAVEYDRQAEGEAALKVLNALKRYRETRADGRKQLETAIDVHKTAKKIALEWDASDDEYELEVEQASAAPGHPVEPRPRLRHANEVLREMAAEYFTPESLTGGETAAAVGKLVETAGRDSKLVSGIYAKPPAAVEGAAGAKLRPFVAARYEFFVQKSKADGIGPFADRVEGDRRLLVDSISARAHPGVPGLAVSGTVFALALDLRGVADADAQAALDAAKNSSATRVHLGPVVAALAGGVPDGMSIRSFLASPAAVEIQIGPATLEDARAYGEALRADPAFEPFAAPELHTDGDAVHLVFHPAQR